MTSRETTTEHTPDGTPYRHDRCEPAVVSVVSLVAQIIGVRLSSMQFWIGFAAMLVLSPTTAHAQDPARRQCNYSSSSVIDECVRAKIDSLEGELRKAVARVLELLPDSARSAFLATGAKWNEYRRHECAAVRAAVADRPEAARIHIECGGLLAIERTSALSTMYYPQFSDNTTHGGCVPYEPDTVQVTGVLERRIYPGPPNYASVRRGAAREVGYYLRVTDGLCVTRNVDEINVPTAGVRRVQLIVDAEEAKRLKSMVRRRVTMRGSLAHASTGHHHAELLLRVQPEG